MDLTTSGFGGGVEKFLHPYGRPKRHRWLLVLAFEKSSYGKKSIICTDKYKEIDLMYYPTPRGAPPFQRVVAVIPMENPS